MIRNWRSLGRTNQFKGTTVCREHGIEGRSGAFSMVEVLAAIAIAGILIGISAPSLIGWRDMTDLENTTKDLGSLVNGIPEEARRWGTTCKTSILVRATGGTQGAVDVQCNAKATSAGRLKCGANSKSCDLTTYGKTLSALNPKVFVSSNSPELTHTPRGLTAGNQDTVYVIGILRQYKNNGGASTVKCITATAVSGRVGYGVYRGALGTSDQQSVSINTALNPQLCY